ncbi:hypothetical protein P7K49_014885 [Saguinus oedipus]|uniref:Uncharacterized protein n=1 Tax=Saguinus oedipus TaxID=9490 RepID=A0ABQ9V7N6_SAGOE|nr:hypothetical protein P7K49_014885 [Saguinus oedipus]
MGEPPDCIIVQTPRVTYTHLDGEASCVIVQTPRVTYTHLDGGASCVIVQTPRVTYTHLDGGASCVIVQIPRVTYTHLDGGASCVIVQTPRSAETTGYDEWTKDQLENSGTLPANPSHAHMYAHECTHNSLSDSLNSFIISFLHIWDCDLNQKQGVCVSLLCDAETLSRVTCADAGGSHPPWLHE